jgi:hypothetical protein
VQPGTPNAVMAQMGTEKKKNKSIDAKLVTLQTAVFSFVMQYEYVLTILKTKFQMKLLILIRQLGMGVYTALVMIMGVTSVV